MGSGERVSGALDASRRGDEALLASIAGRDRDAFAEFYDRYAARMFGLILKLIRRRDAAEDVLQDVFLQVWRKAGDYDSRLSRPLIWLMLVTRGRAIDWLRRHGSAAPAPPGFNGSAHATRPRHDDDSFNPAPALARLPAEQAEAISLAFYGGLTYPQIAELCAVPLGTVKTRIRLGMKKLRETIEQEEEVNS
jgi:RNA polymerase sigma-70 factor (ECF subfamily)